MPSSQHSLPSRVLVFIEEWSLSKASRLCSSGPAARPPSLG
jgi:hypothetical protein